MYFSCTDIVYDDRKLLDIRAYSRACDVERSSICLINQTRLSTKF